MFLVALSLRLLFASTCCFFRNCVGCHRTRIFLIVSGRCSTLIIFKLVSFDDRICRQSGKAICLICSISGMDVSAVGSLGGSSFSPQKFLFFDFVNDFAFRFGWCFNLRGEALGLTLRLVFAKWGANCLPSFMAPCCICLASWLFFVLIGRFWMSVISSFLSGYLIPFFFLSMIHDVSEPAVAQIATCFS